MTRRLHARAIIEELSEANGHEVRPYSFRQLFKFAISNSRVLVTRDREERFMRSIEKLTGLLSAAQLKNKERMITVVTIS